MISNHVQRQVDLATAMNTFNGLAVELVDMGTDVGGVVVLDGVMAVGRNRIYMTPSDWDRVKEVAVNQKSG